MNMRLRRTPTKWLRKTAKLDYAVISCDRKHRTNSSGSPSICAKSMREMKKRRRKKKKKKYLCIISDHK